MSFKVCFHCFKFICYQRSCKSDNEQFIFYLESIRVERFREHANAADEDDEEDVIDQLSELMNKSHHSLKTLYECSHKNLDKLVDISHDMGVGARLTGAGWGGCIVALTDSITTCDRYITTLKKSYYDHIPHSKHLDLDDVVFATVNETLKLA
jgi:N-acetylgalactosamine kinase